MSDRPDDAAKRTARSEKPAPSVWKAEAPAKPEPGKGGQRSKQDWLKYLRESDIFDGCW